MRDTWDIWHDHAQARHYVMLANGSVAQLLCVKRAPRSCKIKLGTRHYMCWIEDIIAVSDTPEWASSMRWYDLDPWKVFDVAMTPRDIRIRPRQAPNSKHWLRVTPDPRRLAVVRRTPDPALETP